MQRTLMVGVPAVSITTLFRHSEGAVLCLPSHLPGKVLAAELERWLRSDRVRQEPWLGLSWSGSQTRPGSLTDKDLSLLAETCLRLRSFMPPLSQLWGHHNPQITDLTPVLQLLRLPWTGTPQVHLSHCGIGSLVLRVFLSRCFVPDLGLRVEANPMRDFYLTTELAEMPEETWHFSLQSFQKVRRGPGRHVLLGPMCPSREQDLCLKPDEKNALLLKLKRLQSVSFD